ncbi:hypothetical protein K0M31_015921 [Melipona bicolor]|uniref:Uncharacterized protein n=1 Tax=Melipona bicolor TaxID=60889 RepID=A0AA40G5Z6_9HYME|nr:hypothetical protein K0M31_015921 [Melipona bicolor]
MESSPGQSAIEPSRVIEPPSIRWRVIHRHVTLHRAVGALIFALPAVAPMLSSRGQAEMPRALHPLACYPHHKRPDIYTVRFCSSHLCNKCGPVRAWSGLEYALGKYRRAPLVGFQQKCRVAVCELAPVVRPGYKVHAGLPSHPTVLVCARTPVFTIVVSRIQGFRSLLPAITVARRAGVIALIGSCTCARAQLGHASNACGER